MLSLSTDLRESLAAYSALVKGAALLLRPHMLLWQSVVPSLIGDKGGSSGEFPDIFIFFM